MSGTKNRPHKRRNIILLVLLALLCIGGVELLVCRFAAPELFQRLAAPVAGLMQRVSDFGEALHSNLQELLSRPGEDEMVNQLAGPPAIEEVPPAEESKVTEFVTRDGREYLTGGVVDLVYYNQGEEPWASQTFGNDPIRGYGCGPTAMAMLASSLTGEETDPGAMADWAYQQGYCAPGSGSYLSIVEGTASAIGLEAEAYEAASADALVQQLASGHLFVALMTRGHFTERGHFIILRGVTLEGRVLVADPNSRERSLAAWGRSSFWMSSHPAAARARRCGGSPCTSKKRSGLGIVKGILSAQAAAGGPVGLDNPGPEGAVALKLLLEGLGSGTGRRGLPGQKPLQLLLVFRRKDAALLRQVGLVFPQLVDRLLPELEKELNGDRIPPLYGGGELSRQLKHLGERRIDAALRGQHRSELLFRQHLYALLRRSGGAFFRLPEAVPQL